MGLMEQIDALRAGIGIHLTEIRECTAGGVCLDCIASQKRVALLRARVEELLETWWAQGCREIEPPKPVEPLRPTRCWCGAYAWPANMAPDGVISDVASRHRADKCWSHPIALTEATTTYLAEVLYALTSDQPDSKFDPDIVAWRKRVLDAVKRNVFTLPPKGPWGK